MRKTLGVYRKTVEWNIVFMTSWFLFVVQKLQETFPEIVPQTKIGSLKLTSSNIRHDLRYVYPTLRYV